MDLFVGMSMDVALIDSRLKRPNLKSFLGVQRTVFGMMGITHLCIQYDEQNRIEDIDRTKFKILPLVFISSWRFFMFESN